MKLYKTEHHPCDYTFDSIEDAISDSIDSGDMEADETVEIFQIDKKSLGKYKMTRVLTKIEPKKKSLKAK